MGMDTEFDAVYPFLPDPSDCELFAAKQAVESLLLAGELLRRCQLAPGPQAVVDGVIQDRIDFIAKRSQPELRAA